MDNPKPIVVILAGPNGAGKSTAAPALLQGTLGVTEFVNADAIARGLSAFNVDGVAIAAGRVMLQRLKTLSRQGTSFAFETTLASRTFAPWLDELRHGGYAVHLGFLWLSSPELAVQRVADRVAMGGHAVPESTVRRRYQRGLNNFLSVYRDRTDTWSFLDSSRSDLRLVAERLPDGAVRVYDGGSWKRIVRHADKT
ncbi:MAG: zeta toxin family protein [Acidobacteriota bacterium]